MLKGLFKIIAATAIATLLMAAVGWFAAGGSGKLGAYPYTQEEQ